MSRQTERVIAAIAVGSALLFAAAVFVWRVVFDDAPWSFPRLPRMDQFGAFEIYSWVPPTGFVAIAAMLVVAAIRRRGRWVAPVLAAVISMATSVLYLPFWFLSTWRVDRLLGVVQEPVYRLRVLVATVVVTLALAVLFVVVTRLRRTPEVARHTALVTALIANVGLLFLVWVPMLFPFVNGWLPVDWNRPDLLVAVRPCRGAMLWGSSEKGPSFGVVDDIWTRFADPRKGVRQHGPSPSAVNGVATIRGSMRTTCARCAFASMIRLSSIVIHGCVRSASRRLRGTSSAWNGERR